MPVFLYAAAGLTEAQLAGVRRFATTVRDARVVIATDPLNDTVVAGLAEVAAFLDADAPGAARLRPNVRTILFTDIAGSTSAQTRLGDAVARSIVRAHDIAVRRSLERHSGREVKHTGDGIMAVFASAVDAVNCALDVRRDVEALNAVHEGEKLLVRFGLNAGEPIPEDDDLFGLSVTLAARIGDWGAPGQVLCSNVVRELCAGKAFEFTSLGEATLKGFSEPVALFEVHT